MEPKELPESLKIGKRLKAGILDLKLRLADGRKINVEFQNYWTDFFPRRSLYYWVDMYAGDLEKGDKYDRLEKCITINLHYEIYRPDYQANCRVVV